MFSHVMLGANDIAASKAFYDATLGALGHPPGFINQSGRAVYATPSGIFVVTKPINGEPASHGNGSTLGFAAQSTDEVEAWHAAGVANGGTPCEEPPGIRDSNGRRLYLAYLLDPTGNKLCCMFNLE